MSSIIECDNLVKIYKTSDIEVVALQGLDLNVEEGEMMGIIGSSGNGKSTLLNMIGGLDKPSAGRLIVDGKDLFKLSNSQMDDYKKFTVGFIWQNNSRNLIPYLTAKQNIEYVISLGRKKTAKFSAMELLEMVGLTNRANSKLAQLSGGEQQRTALAIALCNNPKILLADEPTGALDSKTTDRLMDLFKDLNDSINLTVVIVTHNRLLTKKVDRFVEIRDGRTSSEFVRKINFSEDDSLEELHEEFAVIDRAGRIQIPAGYLEKVGLKNKNKLKVEIEDNRIVLVPPEN